MDKRGTIFGLLLIVAGCASAVNDLTGGTTPYRTEFELLGSWHGTRAELIEDQIYKVRTTVNPNTSITLMTEYNLLKAAQLAIENGYTHFAIEADEAQHVTKYYQNSASLDTRREVGRNYSAAVIIRLLNHPGEDETVISAQDVIAKLGPKHLQ